MLIHVVLHDTWVFTKWNSYSIPRVPETNFHNYNFAKEILDQTYTGESPEMENQS